MNNPTPPFNPSQAPVVTLEVKLKGVIISLLVSAFLAIIFMLGLGGIPVNQYFYFSLFLIPTLVPVVLSYTPLKNRRFFYSLLNKFRGAVIQYIILMLLVLFFGVNKLVDLNIQEAQNYGQVVANYITKTQSDSKTFPSGGTIPENILSDAQIKVKYSTLTPTTSGISLVRVGLFFVSYEYSPEAKAPFLEINRRDNNFRYNFKTQAWDRVSQ